MRRFFTTNLLHFFSVLIISNILLGMFLLPISQTYADTVHLKNGSKLTGLILTKFPQEATTVSITLSPTSTLEVHQNQILKITQNKPNKQAYLTRRRTAPHTIKSHLELAKLCKKNGWHTDRNLHLNRILEIDPQHNFSNRELGNKKKQGHWLSPKEFLLSRGLFLYEGRYRPHQAIELLKRKKKTRELEAAWKEKIYRWRRWLSDRREKRVLQAHKGLQTLTDPYAASALIALIEEEKDPQVLRMLLHSASQIESQTTFTYLLGAALFEPHEETRLQCLEYIQKANRPGTTQYYLRFLEDRQNHIVNRAAVCLQQLADQEAIALLIEALSTKHIFQPDSPPSGQTSVSMDSSGTTSFGSKKKKTVTKYIKNHTVLLALIKLTEKNFSYDKERWRKWLAYQNNAQHFDLRRENEP